MMIQFKEVSDLFDEFNEIAWQSQNMAIFTRDIELQKNELEKLEIFLEKANTLKNENKSRFPEAELNFILFLILSLEAVKSELNMIISLKENNMDSAWASLINAQGAIANAANNHPFNMNNLDGYIAKLNAYEQILFPKMLFTSVGTIIKKTKCTICGLEYEDCDHIKGKMYNGELCIREILECDLEEVSLVEDPANKLCRVLATDFNGKQVDVLTLKEKT